jgi:predicted RNase H-like nuclease (RuvC/YqgF family)
MPKTAMEKLDYDSMSPNQLIQTFGADAFEALKKGKMDEFIQKQKVSDTKQAIGNNPYLHTLMEVAPTITDTNAADFLAKYKDFRDRTFRLSQRLRDPRVEEVEKQKMQEALTQARQMQIQMKEVLDAGLGEYKPEFERVNKGYSEQVYPLRNNPVVEKAHEGKLSDNIIKSLRTNEEGMPLVREIVKQDPELLRNVVGQRYFSSKAGRESIHKPNEMTREYLDEMPDLKQMLSQKQNANAALEQAKSNAEMAKQHHADISKRQTEATKIEKKAKDMQADIDASKKEVEKLEKHIENLKKTASRKNISLKEKMQSEKELKDLRKQLRETSSQLDEKTTGLRKYLRAAKLIYRGGKFITTGS